MQLDIKVKDLIDSLKYQLKRLEIENAPSEEINETSRMISYLEALYKKLLTAPEQERAEVEKAILLYIRVPKTVSFFDKYKRFFASVAAFIALVIGVAIWACSRGHESTEEILTNISETSEDFCVVEFIANGRITSSQTIKSGECAAEPSVVYQENKSFLGWFYEDGEPYYSEKPIYRNTSITALFLNTKFDNSSACVTELKRIASFLKLNIGFFYNYKEKILTLNVDNKDDFLEFAHVLSLNADLFSNILINLNVTPDMTFTDLPANLIYNLNLRGDFSEVSLKEAASGLPIYSVYLMSGTISTSDLEYFLNYPDLFFSIISDDFSDWDFLSGYSTAGSLAYFGAKINSHVNASNLTLPEALNHINIDEIPENLNITAQSEILHINLDLPKVYELNNLSITCPSTKIVQINIVLPDNFVGNIMNNSAFQGFLSNFSGCESLNININDSQEEYNGILTPEGLAITASNSGDIIGYLSSEGYQNVAPSR
ncbi:MAG: hypothetical protein K2J20_06700 [Bacilli bacterium]|nr:hypothetical protein [Bacilli bacterium]